MWLHYVFSLGLLCDDYIGDIDDTTRIIYCDYTRTFARTYTRGNTRAFARTITRGNTRGNTRAITRTYTRIIIQEAPAP